MSEETAVTEDAPESPSETASDAETESPSEQVEAKADEEASPAAEAAEADAEPEEWKNLVNKYKGNKELAGKAYWKAVNDNAALAKENKELKAYRDAAEKAAKEKADPPPPHPTLKQVDDYITALTKEVETLPREEAKHYGEYKAAEKIVHRLEFELEQADRDDDKISSRALKAELKVALKDMRDAERDVLNTQQKHRQAQYDIERGKAYRKQVEQQIEAEARAKQEQEANLADFMETFPDEIDGYLKHYQDEFKIPADERDDVKTTVYEHLISRCKGSNEDADQDWKGMVKDRVAKEAKRIERAGRAHFAQVSKEKKAVTAPAVAKPSSKSDEKTPAYLKDDELTPGMARGRAYLQRKGL